ncbi:MAG: PKD domain-containing protein, partial [Methanolinea sp.]
NSTGNPTSWLWNFGDGATSTEKNPCHTYISPGIYSVTLTVTNACGSDTLTRHDYIIATNQPPVASFTANKTMGNPPLSVQFTDTSSGEDIASWAWNFGDGGTSTEPNPMYTYQNPGLYSVTLTVGNDGGTNSTTKTDYIRVFQNVPVADFIAEPTSGTSPLVVQFHDITPGTPTTFLWNFGDGAKSPMQSPSHTYENSGNYTVSLTVGTSGGTNTTVKEDFIQVSHEFDVPVANFTTEYFYYGRFYAYGRFQDTSTGNPTSWNWTFGDGHYSEYQDPWYEYDGVGSYDVTLTVSNAAGSDSITKEAFIVIPTPAPEADFYVAPRDRYGSFPLTVLFQDQSEGSIDWDTPPATYEWDFGDGSPNSTERGSVYHNYMAAGTYTVTLTVTDIGGSDTLTRENYIGQAPPPQPIADFTATPKSGYAPLTVDFIDQSTGSPAMSYAWAFGDGTVSTEKDPTHVFSTPGLYNITHVTTNTGGSDSITKPGFIEVLPAPVEIPLNAEFTSNVTTGTVPLTVQFLDASEGSPSSWSWYFESGYYYLANELDKTSLIPAPGGNQISAEKNPVMTYESPGNYTVILTVSRTGETDTIEKVDYIQVTPPPPTADFYAYNNEGPAPLEVEFDAYVPYWYYIDNWTWDFGDGTGETKTSPWTLHTYQNPGLYNVTLSVTSPYGSDISTQVNCVNVTQVLPPVPSFDAVPESGNAPLSVTFTDTSSGTVTTRLWDFGDGTTVWANATAEVTHTYPLPGTYTVSLTAGNEGGQAIVEMPDLITVNPSGPLPDAKFRQSPGMGYAPLTVAFTDLSTGSPLKWEWDFGDGSGSALQNPSHTFTDAGRFTVTLTVYNSGGSDSYSTTVWVRAPRAPVAYFMTDRTFGQAPLSVHFTDRSVNSPTSWSWDFGDGVISIEKNPTHTYTTPGTYFAKLTVANAGGSSSTSRKIYVR